MNLYAEGKVRVGNNRLQDQGFNLWRLSRVSRVIFSFACLQLPRAWNRLTDTYSCIFNLSGSSSFSSGSSISSCDDCSVRTWLPSPLPWSALLLSSSRSSTFASEESSSLLSWSTLSLSSSRSSTFPSESSSSSQDSCSANSTKETEIQLRQILKCIWQTFFYLLD